MASAPTYITHKELKRIFPQLDEFDGKTAVYGWTLGLSNFDAGSLDLYYSHNTGLVDTLFFDGAEVEKISFNTVETTKLDGAMTESATTFYVDAAHGLAVGDILKINNEYLRVASVDSDTITTTTATRGFS